jgi:hypothetical protein
MVNLKFMLTLTSDAEPGTGQAGLGIDDFITRNGKGVPVVRASHLKGLMRDRLESIAGSAKSLRHSYEELLQACFGRPGAEGDDGCPSSVYLSDAEAQDNCTSDAETQDSCTTTISRTAINPLGTAAGITLRTTEAIPAGTKFTGHLRLTAEEGDPVDLAVRLALLSVEAVGAGRTRGAGACLVDISDETRLPGQILMALSRRIAEGDVHRPLYSPSLVPGGQLDKDAPAVWLRFVFEASDPVCCPETPIVGVNVIRSGFAIPASAVQGALLTRISERDPALASACLEDARFRAWPLLPAPRPEAGSWFPVRVSLTHKMSKLPQENGRHDFKDASIEPYDWKNVPEGSPLKASDGVLLLGEKEVLLWRSAEMPRLVSAHGVHRDPEGNRNLFTVEAMAPLQWSGLVAMPPEASRVMAEILTEDAFIAFGKARSIRGGGSVRVEPFSPPGLEHSLLPEDRKGRVFVVQSPLLLPASQTALGRPENALGKLVQDAEWGKLAPDQDGIPPVWANAGIRFGWNRHGHGTLAVVGHRRLRAQPCILPGSVFVLAEPLTDLPKRLLAGIGGGRDQGFGTILPHPGLAEDLYKDSPPRVRKTQSNVGRLGLRLWQIDEHRGPSPSQIGALIGRLSQDKERTREYLKKQIDRPERTFRRWRKVFGEVDKLINEQSLVNAVAALRVWQDLAVSHREERHR